ncbi:MAG: hypothetical protein IJI66_13970 [Erysipelotrichaceae bacterium]|nr:hypothetical protein [Erysipelotrichaceae bacterium]
MKNTKKNSKTGLRIVLISLFLICTVLFIVSRMKPAGSGALSVVQIAALIVFILVSFLSASLE